MIRRITAVVLSLALTVSVSALADEILPGVLDFITRYESVIVPENADESVRHDMGSFTSEDGSMKGVLREVLFDGKTLHAVLDITSENTKAMFLHADTEMEYPSSDIYGEGAPGTTLDVYKSGQYETAWCVTPVFPGVESGETLAAACDGFAVGLTYTLYMKVDLAEDTVEKEFDLPIDLIPLKNPGIGDNALDEHNKVTIPVKFTISANNGTDNRIEGETPVELPECGVCIDSVVLDKRAMDTYFTITYTVIDEEAYAKMDAGLWINPRNENGEPLPDGANPEGVCEIVSGEDGKLGSIYIQTGSIYLNELPASIYLQPYQCWDKIYFDLFEYKF